MKRFTFAVATFLAAALTLGACTKLPPDTSIEGKLAVRGNQLVQTLRQVTPVVKSLTCTAATAPTPVPTCIAPAVAAKIFDGLETAFKTAEEAADVLKALDSAKTEVEREPLKTKALSLLQTIQKTLMGLTVMPEHESTRNSVVQAISAAMAILISLGSFGAV